jgi:hypothetical protein
MSYFRRLYWSPALRVFLKGSVVFLLGPLPVWLERGRGRGGRVAERGDKDFSNDKYSRARRKEQGDLKYRSENTESQESSSQLLKERLISFELV